MKKFLLAFTLLLAFNLANADNKWIFFDTSKDGKISTDSMFLYCWWEKSNPNECKFGERWCFSGQDPETEVRNRILGSLGVRKDIYNQGDIVLESITFIIICDKITQLLKE